MDALVDLKVEQARAALFWKKAIAETEFWQRLRTIGKNVAKEITAAQALETFAFREWERLSYELDLAISPPPRLKREES